MSIYLSLSSLVPKIFTSVLSLFSWRTCWVNQWHHSLLLRNKCKLLSIVCIVVVGYIVVFWNCQHIEFEQKWPKNWSLGNTRVLSWDIKISLPQKRLNYSSCQSFTCCKGTVNCHESDAMQLKTYKIICQQTIKATAFNCWTTSSRLSYSIGLHWVMQASIVCTVEGLLAVVY